MRCGLQTVGLTSARLNHSRLRLVLIERLISHQPATIRRRRCRLVLNGAPKPPSRAVCRTAVVLVKRPVTGRSGKPGIGQLRALGGQLESGSHEDLYAAGSLGNSSASKLCEPNVVLAAKASEAVAPAACLGVPPLPVPASFNEVGRSEDEFERVGEKRQ